MNRAWDFFKSNKKYWVLLGLVLLGSYGFAITHHSIGIDDTCIELYFEDGIAPAMGRWCIYLLGKVINITSFAPWFMELVSTLIFAVSVTLWAMLFYRILGDKVSWAVYCMFACVFVSCPLISEVYVYYLHNGLCTGYGVVALALHALLDVFVVSSSWKKRICSGIISVVGLLVSIGFYESFLLVFAFGAIMVLFLLLDAKGQEEKYIAKPFRWAGVVAGIAMASILLRSVVLHALQFIFGYSIPENYTVGYRSIFENLGQDKGELMMALKKYIIMYWANAYAYFPIAVLVAGFLIIGLYALVWKRNIWMVLCSLAMGVLPALLVIIEGYPTHYRASQYVPLVGAFALLLVGKELCERKTSKYVKWAGVAGALILIFNQCADMNKWFYVDYLKYQDAENVMRRIAYDLESQYDTSKPIVFRGAYMVPYEICKDAYVEYGSEKYYKITRIADLLGEHVKDKFNDSRAFRIAETPLNSTLQWGVTAFDGTATQLGEFWKMLGCDNFIIEQNLTVIENAEQYMIESGMPGYPQEGYIAELEDYIIVNLTSN
ncbi:MAG: glucosyltransferase domain-containing protein [Lachnospiraceae bacterium]|nr:glucosyltransferase domain-containing protein [Lachnospiraceae bacterium]